MSNKLRFDWYTRMIFLDSPELCTLNVHMFVYNSIIIFNNFIYELYTLTSSYDTNSINERIELIIVLRNTSTKNWMFSEDVAFDSSLKIIHLHEHVNEHWNKQVKQIFLSISADSPELITCCNCRWAITILHRRVVYMSYIKEVG